MSAGLYALYKAQLSSVDEDGSKTVVEKSWFTRGNLLMVVGYRRGESDFAVRNYRNSIYSNHIMKIERVNEDGSAEIISRRYGDDSEEE